MDISTENSQPGASRVLAPVRRYFSGGRGWLALALIIASAGTYLGWGWLVAAGVAPVLIALAPCAAMCALGLCMRGSRGSSCSNGASEQARLSEPQTKR